MRESLVGRFVGSSVRRVEDGRLLTGEGCYVDDVALPGMVHATFLRSPFPHATIGRIDTSAAARLPGVRLILTGADMVRMTNPFMGMLAFDGLYDPVFYALAVDRVRLVGDPVAIVVADSRRIAEDACELIEVDYDPLPPVGTMKQALSAMVPPIWPKAKSNVLWHDSQTYGDVDGAFARADRVIRERFEQHRQTSQPLETRGCVAEIDRSGNLVFHSATQSAHLLRWSLGLVAGRLPMAETVKRLVRNPDKLKRVGAGAYAFVKAHPDLKGVMRDSGPAMAKQLWRDPQRLVHMGRSFLGLIAKEQTEVPRVLAGDIGGAFGAKGFVHREEVALAAAALALGRSVKWVEDRNESLALTGHAREENVDIELAVRSDGTILGMKVHMTMDTGAYPGFPFGATFISQMVRVLFPGPYRVPAFRFDTTLLASNKATYVAYRGPWAVETWVRERMLDIVAGELGLSRAEIRLRNMIGHDELPTSMITGPPLDIRMSARRTLEETLRIAEFDSWEKVQAKARAEGRVVGLGIATYIEPAPGPPRYFDYLVPGFSAFAGVEPAHALLERDGRVTILTQQVPNGQGHQTTLAQIAADQLGVPIEAVDVRYGDTSITPFSILGTAGSRAAAMAGGVVTLAAGELRQKIADIAADLLEAAPEDIVTENGSIHVAGVPSRCVSYGDVAAEAVRRGGADRKSGAAMRVVREYDGGAGGWSQATHACWVEIDLDTGVVRIPRYVVVEDCGELIHPAIVEGQIRGGIAQGVGAVLYEKAAYSEDGNFLAGTFMDFLIPTVMEIPAIEIHHLETPSGVFANYRGVGEGGMIAAPAAITNAIEDALRHIGVRVTEQYLPPGRILELAGVIPAE